jgi:ferredoxin
VKLQNLRRASQAAFLAVTLTGVILGTTGMVYPYFFCYSNPWDVGNCPLGLLEHGSVDVQNMFWTGLALLLYVVGFLALVGVVFGRAFCGWACPVGTLQDIARKFKVSDTVARKLRPNVDPRYKNIKYLILLAIPITAYLSKDLFYTNLCPVGGVTGTIPTLLFYPSSWTLGSSIMVKITSVVLFTILIILVARGWCKYLCPIGAFLAPWNKVSAIGVRRDESACKHCSLCEKTCPMDIRDIGTKPEKECVLCGRCVDSCKFGSLKLGAVPRVGRKAMAIWTVLLFLSAGMMAGGVWLDGYSRAHDINSLPCLGCLALDPHVEAEWLIADNAQPGFIVEPLATGPVFLHYRTDVCPGCDEMEPHIGILEAQYGDRVEFIHINLDHATAEEDASYDIFDFTGTPAARFGVPMFSTVIVVMNGTEPEINFMTQYGSSSDQGESKRLELEDTINEALARHTASAGPIVPIDPSDPVVLSELFVGMGCVNCYKSEHALEVLEATGESNFATFITDAPGVSGAYASYREDVYQASFGPAILGHPWAVFAGGPGNSLGALSTESAIATYRAMIAEAHLAPVNLSLSGYFSRSGEALFSNITVSNLEPANQTVSVEAYVLEKSSRWKNLQGEPIPNAFVDIVANTTLTIAPGDTGVIPASWSGTDQVRFSDMRMGNTAILVTVWKDGVQVTSKLIESSEPDVLQMTAERSLEAALPNGTAEFSFTLRNYMGTGLEVGLSAEPPANWAAELSASSIYIAGSGSSSFTVTFTGNGTSASDPLYDFIVKAKGVADATIQASSMVQVDVKDDITPPTIGALADSPALPRAHQQINVSVTVTDASGLESVKLSYFSCTPEACSPYFIVDMNLTSPGGNEYTASVYPIGQDHTDLHYRIIATDLHGNTMTTVLHDVELEPVEHYAAADTTKPKWMGVVVLCVFALIAVAVALSSREKQQRKDRRPDEVPEEEEPGGKV